MFIVEATDPFGELIVRCECLSYTHAWKIAQALHIALEGQPEVQIIHNGEICYGTRSGHIGA